MRAWAIIGGSVPASSATSPGTRLGGACPRKGDQLGPAGAEAGPRWSTGVGRATGAGPKGNDTLGIPRTTAGPAPGGASLDLFFGVSRGSFGGRTGPVTSPVGWHRNDTPRAGVNLTRERSGARAGTRSVVSA